LYFILKWKTVTEHVTFEIIELEYSPAHRIINIRYARIYYIAKTLDVQDTSKVIFNIFSSLLI